MTPENFTYWLQGFVELNGDKNPNDEQWKMIVKHLQLVFTNVTKPESPDRAHPLENNPSIVNPYRDFTPGHLPMLPPWIITC